MRLFLIRHGAVIPPQPGAFYGDADVPLSQQGQAEARQAAQSLAALALDHIVASPLPRARFGAEQLAAGRGLAIAFDDDLREIQRGRWYGLTRAEVEARFPGDLAAHETDYESWQGHGGEARGVFRDRVLRALDRLLTDWQGRSVAVVSHSFTTRAILAAASGLPLASWETLPVPTASISLVDYAPPAAPTVRLVGYKPDGRCITDTFPAYFPTPAP